MSNVTLKAAEIRSQMKMMLPTSDAKKSSYAKRVRVSITKNKEDMGILLQTRQVGFGLKVFVPVVNSELQQSEQLYDIVTGPQVVNVDSQQLYKALSTFGSQPAFITLMEDGQVRFTNESSSVISVNGECEKFTAEDVMKGWQEDAEVMAECSVRVPLMSLLNALQAATKIAMMPGNLTDMRGVHFHTVNDDSLHIVAAHKQALFVCDMGIKKFTEEQSKGLDCIVMPEAAGRLREALMMELAVGDAGAAEKEVLMVQTGDGLLCVCCGNWMMHMDVQEMCKIDCTTLMESLGKNVLEVERAKLQQALTALKTMGETEFRIVADDSLIHLSGDMHELTDTRYMVVPCTRYGADEELYVRKYVIAPLLAMLSAASTAEQNKMVKLLMDAEKQTMCVTCDNFTLFVK